MIGLVTMRPAGGAGVSDHGLLAGLLDDDHSQYALLAGRAGGQTLKGGSAASEHLTLQSTANAVRGYVRAQDDLQLLTDILRGSDGVNRLQLAAALPHLTLTGNAKVTASLGIVAAPVTNRLLNCAGTLVAGLLPVAGGAFELTIAPASGARAGYGLSGAVTAAATGTGTVTALGLYFNAAHANPNTTNSLWDIYVMLGSTAAGSGALTEAGVLRLQTPSWVGSKPATLYGIDLPDMGAAGVATAYGFRLADQTATTVRLLELGPAATPYLRLTGGAAPGANLTNLYLNEGGVLRQVRIMDPGAGGGNFVGGERVCIL